MSSNADTLLALVREKLAEHKAYNPEDATVGQMGRFLAANGDNVQKAFTAYTNYLNWRVEQSIDTLLDNRPAKAEWLWKLIPWTCPGLDNENRPIHWELTGKVYASALSRDFTPEEFARVHAFGFETLLTKGRANNKEKGLNPPQETICTVLDLNGIGLGAVRVLSFLQATLEMDQKYYPERVGKVLVINPPSFLPYLYGMVKYFTPASMQSRVAIVHGDILAGLQKHMPLESIPAVYGGTSPATFLSMNEEDQQRALKGEDPFKDWKKVNVAAGVAFTETITVPKGSSVAYTFLSEGKYDVDFYIKQTVEGKETIVRKTERLVSAEGSFEFPDSDATLSLVWDNTYSWVNSKDVKFLVQTAALTASAPTA